jgi:hypothetical protein
VIDKVPIFTAFRDSRLLGDAPEKEGLADSYQGDENRPPPLRSPQNPMVKSQTRGCGNRVPFCFIVSFGKPLNATNVLPAFRTQRETVQEADPHPVAAPAPPLAESLHSKTDRRHEAQTSRSTS